jgi:hypothetical protein
LAALLRSPDALRKSSMPFSLDRVVPWGRSLAEYRRMFALTEEQFRMRILGCADGPASFNAEATALGSMLFPLIPFTLLASLKSSIVFK